MSALIPRATIAQIVAYRDQALILYAEAHEQITAANEKLREAGVKLRAAAPVKNGFAVSMDQREKMFASYSVAALDEFMHLARHMVDADVWAYIVEATELQRLMDKKAKEQLREQLAKDPPEVTVDNALATLEGFAQQSGEIFRRGIAEAFSNLDRRFRSHDGFKIGSRVILNRAFDDNGFWNYYRDHRATLVDIERVFHVLDGKTPPLDYAGIIGEIDHARRNGFSARQTAVESDYYRVNIFKNGNAHLWFKRDDLVEQVNKLLAEYYGEVIPDGRATDDDGGLHEAKRSVARNFGFFPTPQALVERVIEEARLHRWRDSPQLRVLEPSAGTGNLATAVATTGAEVTCIEIQSDLAAGLSASGRYRKVWCRDFLDTTLEMIGTFDRVVMNPPFDRERDIDHVMHALKFLAPGGRLVSIMSAHTDIAETRKASAFRDHIAGLGGGFVDLPARSFASVGTNVNTVLLSVGTGRSS